MFKMYKRLQRGICPEPLAIEVHIPRRTRKPKGDA